jgi:SpoVK/Ycf46/Vps4 family AAA+-type ATPase
LCARAKTAQWLIRLADRDVPFDAAFFACFAWSIGGLRRILQPLEEYVKTLPRRSQRAKIGKALREVADSPAHRLDDELEDFLEKHPSMRSVVQHVVRRECLAVVQKYRRTAEIFPQAVRRLRRVFGVGAELARFCEFVFILQTFSPVEKYFEDSLEIHLLRSRHLPAAMLDISEPALKRCIDEAASSGLIRRCEINDAFRLRDELMQFWESCSGNVAKGVFCAPLSGKTLPLEHFKIPQEEIDHVKSLLARPGDAPTHILLYGPPGTGKTTFAASLAASLKVRAWSVVSRKDDDDDDRRSSLSACLHTASRHPGSFVLVDEAERMLDTDGGFVKNSKDKAWLNDFLERPGRRVIWITNHIRHIDQAVLRRFQYSIHFEGLRKPERKAVWRQILIDKKALRLLPEERIDALAEMYDVPAAVIEESVVQAKSLTRAKETFGLAVERVLRAHVTLRSGGDKPRPKKQTLPGYTPEGVCLEGSMDELLELCRRLDARMRGNGDLLAGSGTMLFYGPPGTGKTALARHIAETIERECLVKRADELLSMWVGETEKNIARAFQQAEKEDAVLVIDEADSFLYTRGIAQRSWEATQVNEFLTCLEECRCFCICTTNRREDMDAAAMRRFSIKIPFTFAGRNQVKALYKSLLAPLAADVMTEDEERELLSMTKLAPGDFHAVRARRRLADPGGVTHAVLTADLRREQSMKLEQAGRRIGF